jgi:hypothetical protein
MSAFTYDAWVKTDFTTSWVSGWVTNVTLSNWILISGSWDDSKVWVDSEVWKDG